MVRAIGIDLSLRHTGCVEIDSNFHIRRRLLIELKDKGYPRVLKIVDGVNQFIRQSVGLAKNKVVVAVEDYVIGKGFKSGMDVLKAQGAVVYSLERFKVPCYLVHPARLRHFQLHGPKLGSEWLEDMSEHEVDAWGLAMMALAKSIKIDGKWPKSLRAIIEKLSPIYLTH